MPGRDDKQLIARLRQVSRERRLLRDKRLQELSSQTKERLRREANGLLKRLITLKTRLLDGGKGDDITARLRMAGFRGEGPETIFVILQAALPLMFSALTFAAMSLWPNGNFSITLTLQFTLAAGIGGYTLPGLVLGQLIKRRQKAIIQVFPDVLDLLLICVQSGMSVEASLARVTKDIAGQSVELTEELSLTMAELAYLPSRWRAYNNLGERTGLPMVKMIASALTQAERYGTSISQALTATAKECR
ncbi:MAG: type II secretion system F family protein, partial [Alphaproteobacteria bacterium]